jgi:hypothetical protein
MDLNLKDKIIIVTGGAKVHGEFFRGRQAESFWRKCDPVL